MNKRINQTSIKIENFYSEDSCFEYFNENVIIIKKENYSLICYN